MAQRTIAAVERLATTEQGDVTRLQGVDPPEVATARRRLADPLRTRLRLERDPRAASASVAAMSPT